MAGRNAIDRSATSLVLRFTKPYGHNRVAEKGGGLHDRLAGDRTAPDASLQCHLRVGGRVCDSPATAVRSSLRNYASIRRNPLWPVLRHPVVTAPSRQDACQRQPRKRADALHVPPRVGFGGGAAIVSGGAAGPARFRGIRIEGKFLPVARKTGLNFHGIRSGAARVRWQGRLYRGAVRPRHGAG